MTTTTPRIVITTAIRAMRMSGYSEDYCRAGKYRRDGRALAPTARLAAIRQAMRTPRGYGPLVEDLVRRLPAPMMRAPTLEQRLRAHLTDVYTEVIHSRGGEISIETERGSVPVQVADRADGMVLMRCEGWRQYSKRFGARPATLAYLCGIDDNGRWAVRVPGTCHSVSAARAFVEPADVAKARRAGKRVLRQGDVYAIETVARADQSGDALPSNHAWDAAARLLRHTDPDAPHGALHVPFPCRWAVQSTLRMGRRNGRRRGD